MTHYAAQPFYDHAWIAARVDDEVTALRAAAENAERDAVLDQYTHHRYQQLISADIPADLAHHTRLADDRRTAARALGATDEQLAAADRLAHAEAYRTLTACPWSECSCHGLAADVRTAMNADAEPTRTP